MSKLNQKTRLQLLPVILHALFAFVLCVPSARADTVTGKVVGPDGAPIKGADLYVSVYEPNKGFSLAISSKSDAAGAFTFDLKPLPLNTGEPAAGRKVYGLVTVDAAGFALQQKGLTDDAGGCIVRLRPQAVVHGVAVDAKGKPAAGVPVMLQYWNASPRYDPEGEALNTYIDTPAAKRLHVTSGPDGKWEMTGLPAAGNAVFQIEGDAYVHEIAQAALSSAAAVVHFVARPGAVLTGRILIEDGRKPPAGGTYVTAFGPAVNGYGGAPVNPDGTYTVGGLASGSYILTFGSTGDRTLVAPALTDVQAVEGKKTAIPDVLLAPGAAINVTVTEEGTGIPIPNVSIGFHGPSAPEVPNFGYSYSQTDNDGKVTVYAAPGKNVISANGAPQGFLAPPHEERHEIVVAKGDVKTIAITFTRGLFAEGTVTGEDGKPLGGVHVRMLSPDESDYLYEDANRPASDAAGKWRVVGLTKNDKGFRIAADPQWIVVTPVDAVTLPTAEPIRVVLKRRATLALSGRVIGVGGEPVPDAQVNIYTTVRDQYGNQNSSRSQSLTTDAQGRYHLDTLKPEEQATVSTWLPGWKFVSGGETTRDAAASTVTVSDIKMVRLSGLVAGKVVDVHNKPVAGATVWSLDGDNAAYAKTGADGTFALKSIPESTVKVEAAADRRTASGSAAALPAGSGGKTARPLILTLEDNAAVPLIDGLARQRALLAEAAQELRGHKNVDRSGFVALLARTDPDAALDLAASANSDGRVVDGVRANLIEALASADPDRAAVWGVAQAAKIDDAMVRCRVEGELGIALAVRQPALAAKMYAAAVADGQGGNAVDLNRARLVALAALLRNGDEANQLQQLTTALARPSETGMRMRSIALVGRGDMNAAIEMAASLPVAEKAEFWQSIIRRTLKFSPITARSYMEKYAALKSDKTLPEWYAGRIDDMTISVIEAVGPHDPAAAAAMARGFKAGAEKRWLALGTAARFQTGADAAELLKDAESAAGLQEWDSAGRLAHLAVLAAAGTATAPAARGLWTRAVAVGEKQNFQMNYLDDFILDALHFDPAIGRMIAERVYSNSMSGPVGSQSPYEMMRAAVALSPLDPERAGAMLAGVAQVPLGPGETNDRAETVVQGREAIAHLLTLPPDQRRTITLSRLMESLWEN